MDLDRWEQIKENIKSNFEVIDEGTEDLIVTTADGEVKNGTAEFLVAKTPMGQIKLVFESRPVVLGKKEFYSHQQGKAARVEYEYSDTEQSHKLKAYKWDDYNEEWKEIDATNFSG